MIRTPPQFHQQFHLQTLMYKSYQALESDGIVSIPNQEIAAAKTMLWMKQSATNMGF